MKLIAVVHDGHYHNDKIVFEPLIDQVEYEDGYDLEDIRTTYYKSQCEKMSPELALAKAKLIEGAFICSERMIEVMCGSTPASMSFGAGAASQNAYRLKSLASGSVFHLGVLPEVEYIQTTVPRIRNKRRDVENLADTIADELRTIGQIKDLFKPYDQEHINED